MKKTMYPAGLIATALLSQATPVAAQSDDSFFDIGIGGAAYVGTLGVGAQGALALNNNVSVIAGADLATINWDISDAFDVPLSDGASLKVDGSTPYAMLGFHPFGNDIRIAGGVAYSSIKADGQFKYDGLAYDGDVDLKVVAADGIAPLATFGFVQNPRGGIGVYTEVGVMFSGKLDWSLTVEDNCLTGNAACEADRAWVEENATAAADDALSSYPGFYPIARFGVQIAF